MPFADFEAFCDGLCELHGFATPALNADDLTGAQAFSMLHKGVAVSVMQEKAGCADAVLLVAEPGAIEPADELSRWLALLEANASSPGPRGPRFACSIASAQPVLMWRCELDGLSVRDVAARIGWMADAALAWRDTGAVPAAHWAELPHVEPAGGDVQQAQEGAALLHEPRNDGRAAVTWMLTPLIPRLDLQAARQLMQLNFDGALVAAGPLIAREPRSGELVLTVELPLDVHDAREYADPLQWLALMTEEWARQFQRTG